MVLRRPTLVRRRPVVLTKRGWVVLALAVGLGLLAAYLAGTVNAGTEVFMPTELVVVHQGDTLWSIAGSRTEQGADVRHTLALIESLNQLDGAGLVAGDQLWVPTLP